LIEPMDMWVPSAAIGVNVTRSGRKGRRADAGQAQPGDRRLPARSTWHDQSMTRARGTAWSVVRSARARRAAFSAVLLAITLTAGACGSTSLLGSTHSATSRANASATRAGPHEHPASAAAVAVIKHWAIALQRGDVRAAAGYFGIPSVFGDGPGAALGIHSLAEAIAANEALPCGATFISAARHGPFVNVLFRLTARPGPGGSSCASGVGQTARTNFVIVAGRITVWLRAPDQPGDNGSPTGTTSGGPVV
jgi:hypothetical protein